MLLYSVQWDSGQILPHSWSHLCPCPTGTSHLTLQRELYVAQVTSGGRGPPEFASGTHFSVLQTAEGSPDHNGCIILHLGGQGTIGCLTSRSTEALGGGLRPKGWELNTNSHWKYTSVPPQQISSRSYKFRTCDSDRVLHNSVPKQNMEKSQPSVAAKAERSCDLTMHLDALRSLCLKTCESSTFFITVSK